MKRINIFHQQAATEAKHCNICAASMFKDIADFMDIYGLEKTRQGLGDCIEAARTLQDDKAIFFYHFALNEVHS